MASELSDSEVKFNLNLIQNLHLQPSKVVEMSRISKNDQLLKFECGITNYGIELVINTVKDWHH